MMLHVMLFLFRMPDASMNHVFFHRLCIFPTNTPRVFHVETTWNRTFPRRFNVEYTWSVCRVVLDLKLTLRSVLIHFRATEFSSNKFHLLEIDFHAETCFKYHYQLKSCENSFYEDHTKPAKV